MKKYLLIILFTSSLVFTQEVENTNTTICWDTSFSMIERDLEKELNLLDKIIKKTPNQKIQLLLFDIVIDEKEFKIVDGDWSELKSTLRSIVPDGGTIYDGLETKIKNSNVFFFTDGNQLLNGEMLPIKKANYVINSSLDRNEDFLKKSVLLGRGRLMDFAAISPNNIKSSTISKKELEKPVYGTVYIDNQPSNDIEIQIKGSGESIKTDINGRFYIPAVPGDSILIIRENTIMSTVPIGYYDKDLDIFLKADITNLDEVIVVEKKINPSSKEIINTSNGLKTKESIGYAVQSIGDKEITEVNTNLSQSVSGKFSGVNLGLGQDLTTFSTRVNTSLLGNNYGLVVVDGTPIQQSDSSRDGGFTATGAFIDPENVASVTVLKGFAATNRYGSLGNNGVLLVRTKNGTYGKGKKTIKKSALVKDNIYDPTSVNIIEESATLKTLKNTSSIQEAYQKYLTLRVYNESNDSFYLDAFSFFKDKDEKLASRIISNLWETNPNSESYIKVVELCLRSINNYRIAGVLNNKLNIINPLALQPFFTEAKLQLGEGNVQDALNKFSVLAKGGTYGNMNVNPIKKTLERELKNLVFQNRNNLDVLKIEEKYFKNTQMNKRILIEWSNPKSEFQIQFINPRNRYFNWVHEMEEDDRIKKEIDLGYTMEEFELYDDLKGDWVINAEFLGNLDKNRSTPLVLLCSIYSNFGYPNQTKKVIVLHLNKQQRRKEMARFKI